jgi:hypothetical protein
MAILYKNNAASALASSITNVATSMSVTAGQGALFPTISGSDYFYVTIISFSNPSSYEIVKVTARSTDTFTIVRAQDGTTAAAWSANDRVELRITNALLSDALGERALVGGTNATGTWPIGITGNAGTATTLATGRTIALTGDVTGTSGTFNGSANLSFATTLANSGVAAGTYTKVTVDAKGRVTTGASLASGDLPTYTGTLTSGQVTTALGFTPYNSTNPSGYLTDAMRNRGSVAQASIDTATLDGFYQQQNTGDSDGVLVFNPSGSLGPLQMRFKYTGLFEFRNKTDSANWTSWKTVLHSANYTSYSPSLTGSGASGTWGISITGTSRGVGTSDPAIGTGGLWVTTGTGLNVARNNTAYVVLDANNYNSYSPTLTGTGASGTWGINVTGNAGSATTAAKSSATTVPASTAFTKWLFATNSTSGTADWNDVSNTRPGTGEVLLLGTATNGMGGGNYYHPVNFEYSGIAGTGNVTQLAIAYGSPANEMYMRGRYSSSWTGWVRFLNSSNYNSYSPTLTGGGASGTWGISITGNAATATSATDSTKLPLSGGTVTGQVSFSKTDDHAIQIGTIRGRVVGSQSGEFIHMYERVHIGSPSGWGSRGAPSYGISTYGGADLATDTGSVRITTGSIGVADAGTRGLIFDGNYTSGQYRHRLRKQDDGNGIPLYIDYAHSTANSFTTIARFGGGGSYRSFTVYGSQDVTGDLQVDGYLGVGQAPNGSYRIITNGHVYANSNGNVYAEGRHYSRHGTGTFYESLTTGNYSSYALPLSGGTVTGSTTFNSSIIASGRDIRIFENNSFIEFYVGGDANTYYPVRFDVYAWFHFGSWSISRSYADTAPWDPIGTGSHRGGLTLTWEWSGDGAWGGNDKTIRVNQFSEQYTTMVGGMALSVNGIIVWLRGGNAYYRFHGPGGMYKGATPYYSTYTASNGATFSPRSYNSATVASEVIAKMPIRGESEHYDGNNRVLHAGNYSSYAIPVSGGINMTGSYGLNDSRLYLRTNGDTNHYLWNSDDDWEEMVAYSGTGFRVKSSNGSTLSTFTTSGVYLNALRTDRAEDSGGTFVYRISSGSLPSSARHINLADTTGDPSDVSGGSGITWGSRSDSNPYYMIYKKSPYNNGNSTHTRLVLAWHTGVEIGASPSYGGTRFFNDAPFTGSEIMSVGKGDSNVRVNNNLYVGGNLALHAGNYSSYTFPLGGGWYGSGLPGSRAYGMAISGGEFVIGNGLPNAGQVGVLIDGCYVAGENNGFWSMASDNTWGSRRGMYWDGTYLNFTTNSATTRHSAVYSDGNVTAYSDERVKTNWRDVQENFVARLAAVKSGIFDRTDIELTQAGVSAQSMREVLPEVVIESKEGTLSVAYGNAAMVSAVELAKEIVKLRQELDEMKSKLN